MTGTPANPKHPRPMRIVLVVDGRYPSTGGAEMQARLLARSLMSAGHDVEVVAPRLVEGMPTTDMLDGVPVTRLAYPRIRLLGALWLCVRFAAWLWRRRNAIDAVHVHMARNLAAVAGTLRPFIRPTLTVKISGAWEFDGGILDPRKRHRPANMAFNWAIGRADTMQCVSAFTFEQLAQAGYPKSMLRLIPNAVDLSRFQPRVRGGPTADEPVQVAFVGRLEPVKGLPILIEAWALAAFGNRARLTIVGNGTQRATLERLVRERGLSQEVDFPGEVSDVPERLARTHIYVQPSYQEGLSNAVLEAMAMGLAIVGSRISGNEDVVTDGDNGLLVPSGDAVRLAAALKRLVDDRELTARMGLRSRERIERTFSVPAVLDQLEHAYSGAIETRSVRP